LTDWIVLLAAGMLCGAMLSAPVGPVGVLALLKLARGMRRTAWALALGAICGDSLIAVCTGLGVGVGGELLQTAVPRWLKDPALLRHLAALLLLFFAAVMLQPHEELHLPTHKRRAWATVGFAAALTNPGNLAAFAAAFAWLHAVVREDRMGVAGHIVPVVGVVAGAAGFWWIFLTFGERLVARVPRDALVLWLRRGLALLLAAMAAAALLAA